MIASFKQSLDNVVTACTVARALLSRLEGGAHVLPKFRGLRFRAYLGLYMIRGHQFLEIPAMLNPIRYLKCSHCTHCDLQSASLCQESRAQKLLLDFGYQFPGILFQVQTNSNPQVTHMQGLCCYGCPKARSWNPLTRFSMTYWVLVGNIGIDNIGTIYIRTILPYSLTKNP